MFKAIRTHRSNEQSHDELVKATLKYVKSLEDELKAANEYIEALEESPSNSIGSILQTALVTAPAVAVAAIATPTVAAPAVAIAAATGAIHIATK